MIRLGVTASEACKKHRLAKLFSVMVMDMENKSKICYYSDETERLYLCFEDALKAAKKVAYNIAWYDQMRALDDPNWPTEDAVCLVCIMSGRKVSRKGEIYGTRKPMYAISSQPKEVTERFVMDKRFGDLQISEYTEHPKLTKDMFYQWS